MLRRVRNSPCIIIVIIIIIIIIIIIFLASLSIATLIE